jgi:hypothetical protein
MNPVALLSLISISILVLVLIESPIVVEQATIKVKQRRK